MKKLLNLFLILSLAFVGYRCGDADASSSGQNGAGLSISGNVKGANGMQVYLDKIGISPTSASLVQAKAETSPTGDFSLNVPTAIQAGIYRLRFGVQKVNLVLDGTENNISFTGDLASLNSYQYQLDGSPSSAAYKDMMVKLASRQANVQDVTNFINSTPNSLNAVLVAMQSLGGNKQFMNLFNKAKERTC